MVYGILNEEHSVLCKDYFEKLGKTVATRGAFVPQRQNWIAFQYESPLVAEKARLQGRVELSPGLFCGVQALDDNDPVLMQNNSGRLKDLWGETNGSVKRTALLQSDGGLSENDLYLGKTNDSDLPRKRNCLERLVCWVLQIDD